MECPKCHYQMEALDDACPRCGAPNLGTAPGSSGAGLGASSAARPGTARPAGGAAVPVSGSQSSSSQSAGSRASQMAPHSEEERRRYVGEQWPRHVAMGAGIGLALSIPLGLLLGMVRQMCLVRYPQAGRSFPDTLALAMGLVPAAMLFALPFLVGMAALGWMVGKQWQEAAEMAEGAKYGQSGPAASVEGLSSQAKIFGVIAGIAFGVFFLGWQYVHAQLWPMDRLGAPTFQSQFDYTPAPWEGPRKQPNYYFVINSLRGFLVLAGLVCGYYLGRLQGLLQYNYARNRNFAPAPAGALAGSRASSGPVIQLNGGAWAVGVFAFIMPCIGLLLWMSYAKTDEEKAGAACIGSVLGIIFAVALAVLRAVMRNAATQQY